MLELILAFLVGTAFGLTTYRYYVKRDPEKLERWAAEVRAAKVSIKAKIDS